MELTPTPRTSSMTNSIGRGCRAADGRVPGGAVVQCDLFDCDREGQ